ncbi:dimethyladenosine transferase 1, mitochondrial isoform X2 [Cyclopterus lumpus]|uniref:dimethyladenosine transferase 1, mitochondrial isoform X2 n=1 Tax=Cyclopterus lumpus TaxID=8103 RepID=UPI00148638F5|nr:dimethyladenosine transferase 1, mitochondrial isoform X2 [Cyclopterus lumpus]
MDPPTKRNPAETKATYTAPPGSNLLLSGTEESRKLVMTSLVNQEAGTRHRKPAATKQPPLAIAACRLERLPPPQRVHFSPSDARQRPMAAITQQSTMVVRAVCRYAGRESTEYLSVQLNMPVLYHVQSIHRPCIWEIAVMMLEPTSALTFQLGSSVATMAPMMPNSARTNPNICMPVDAMLPFQVDAAASSALVLARQHSPGASPARRPHCPAASLPSLSGVPAANQIPSSSAAALLDWRREMEMRNGTEWVPHALPPSGLPRIHLTPAQTSLAGNKGASVKHEARAALADCKVGGRGSSSLHPSDSAPDPAALQAGGESRQKRVPVPQEALPQRSGKVVP